LTATTRGCEQEYVDWLCTVPSTALPRITC